MAVLLLLVVSVASTELLGAVLWRWLVVRQKHFVQPVCLAVTAGLAGLTFGSLSGGLGFAWGLWLVSALPFGKLKPWQLWLEAQPSKKAELQQLAVDQRPGLASRGRGGQRRGLTAAQRKRFEDLAKERLNALPSWERGGYGARLAAGEAEGVEEAGDGAVEVAAVEA